MGMFIDPDFGKKKGKLVKLDEGELIGTVKKQKNEVWMGIATTPSGNRIPRLMTEKDAISWSEKTGHTIWKKMKVEDLRKL